MKEFQKTRMRKTKFQADLTPAEDRSVRLFKQELFERVAPSMALPHVDITWTERELESLARLMFASEANPPAEALIRALQD